MSPITQARALLERVENNPEALLFLISGAIDRLNKLEEGEYGRVFKEAWQSYTVPSIWS